MHVHVHVHVPAHGIQFLTGKHMFVLVGFSLDQLIAWQLHMLWLRELP